jgi:hypothetical protein
MSQEGQLAMTIWHAAARLLLRTIQAMAASRWMLALAIMSAGLAYLTVASHVRGGTALTDDVRIPPIIKVIVPPGAKSSHAAAAPSAAQPVSPGFSDAKFRFGFLEFEDDADAPPR